jgi:hypothetical protein
MLSFSLRPASFLCLLALSPDRLHADQSDNRCGDSPKTPPEPSRRLIDIVNAAGSEMDLNLALGFQVFRIELDLVILLLSFGFDEERIAQIVVVQMKRRFVVPVSIGLDHLAIGDLGIFDKDVDVRNGPPVRSTHEPFDGEAMICFMRGRDSRGKYYGQAKTDERNSQSSPSLSRPRTFQTG